jgi:hypothetical protein
LLDLRAHVRLPGKRGAAVPALLAIVRVSAPGRADGRQRDRAADHEGRAMTAEATAVPARLCPSGSACPSQRCRHYLSGCRCTLDLAAPLPPADRARELGISHRQLERIEYLARARLELELCRAIRRENGDLNSGESPADTGGSTILCRVRRTRPDD